MITTYLHFVTAPSKNMKFCSLEYKSHEPVRANKTQYCLYGDMSKTFQDIFNVIQYLNVELIIVLVFSLGSFRVLSACKFS